jgi:DNA-binding transcriptional LysR family regulator
MEFIQLLSFFQIVKTGSFSKASERVFRSQSAVSHQIKKLEEALNTKLFERLGKKVMLTEEGRILFDVVDSFLNDLENVKRQFEDTRQGKSGTLAIASINAIMTYVLPSTVATFVSKFAGIKLRLITCKLISEIQTFILDGIADIGIGPFSKRELPQNLSFFLWKSFDRLLITTKDHPLSQKNKLTLVDVGNYPIILYKKGTIIREDIDQVFSQNKVTYDISMESDETENIKTFVEMGIGISILPSFTISDKDRNNFYTSNASHLFGKTEYGIYRRKDRYVTNAVKHFMNLFDSGLCISD